MKNKYTIVLATFLLLIVLLISVILLPSCQPTYDMLDMSLLYLDADDSILENEILSFVENNREPLEKIAKKISSTDGYTRYMCSGAYNEDGEWVYSVTITQFKEDKVIQETSTDATVNTLISMGFYGGFVEYNSVANRDLVYFSTQLSNDNRHMCFAYAPTENSVSYLQERLYGKKIEIKHITNDWYFYMI